MTPGFGASRSDSAPQAHENTATPSSNLSVEQRLRIVKRHRGKSEGNEVPQAVSPPSESYPAFDDKVPLTEEDKAFASGVASEVVDALLFNDPHPL